jgi:uncharacterized protein (TIGR03000 family)
LAAASLGSQQAPDKTPAMKSATVVVRLPQDDARLTVDGAPTRQRGTERRFSTPPLEPGKKYSYVMVAVWEPNNYTRITRTRKVFVEAGKETAVDLREKDPKTPDDIFVRYVPTPDAVVEAMCKLAGVGKDDVVFDLGCGDGRIVVTAVAKFNAKKGVGVDLDPERIKDSKETAKRFKVEDKVEFRQADVLKLDDLSSASVVMLYMGEDLNLALRPILQKTLKPGSRVVSHRFTMGDWKPDKTETVAAGLRSIQIHLWTIKEPDKEKDKDDKKD